MDFQSFIKEHLHDDVRELALKASRYPEIDMHCAITQIRGWQIASRKLPLWAETEGIEFPEHLPLEQCSSQKTAEYKCSLIENLAEKESMTDLTGGFGVDFSFLAKRFNNAIYVERNPSLCDLALRNMPRLGVKNAKIVNADLENLIADLPHQNLIFLDPARRDENGRKTVCLADCTPDVVKLNDLLLEKSDMTMMKLSPMLDVSSALSQLRGIFEVHIVSLEGECKEILLLLKKGETSDSPVIHAVNLQNDGSVQTFSFKAEDEQNAVCQYANAVSGYLYEPNASLMKACPFKSISERYKVFKLHPNSHLYVSDSLVADFPGRIFTIETVFSFSKQDQKALRELKKANISVRNFPLSVNEIRHRLHLADGGDHYLFATTMGDGKKVIISCRKNT